MLIRTDVRINFEDINMVNLFEKSINLGLGLFSLSREKIEKTVEELVNKGEVARKDAHGEK
jgi:polyhydroxyalkanoate synthesis regulator phasin